MITVRKSNERGHANHGWLDTHHTFSFGQYLDPNHMGYRTLRVINDDVIAPGKGFGTHGHDNMEIVTYVVEGALEHKDSMGNGSTIPAGSFQRITAGAGITHSEFNPSPDDDTHLYQIWILPGEQGLDPSYEEWQPAADRATNEFHAVATPDGRNGSMTIHQDASIHLADINAGSKAVYDLTAGRSAWVQVVTGAVRIGDHELGSGDGAAVEDEERITIKAIENSQVMLFDLA